MSTIDEIKQLAHQFHPQVIAIRRQLHAQPELAYQEYQTAATVVSELHKLGIETTTLAQTGVVGTLRGNNPDSRCIALRADMDALPITELNDIPYKSIHNGVMHACGHDVHTANLLGTAMILAAMSAQIQGTIKFIFQPSEEKMPSGAHAMIESGVLENPKVDAIYGLHVHPELEAGQAGFKAGKFMAAADEIYITIRGKGGHAAQPHAFISALIIAAELLLALQPLTDMSIPTVLSFGKLTADGATNVIPEKAYMAGTLRCFDETVRSDRHQKITAICTEIAARHGGQCEVNIVKGYPVLTNDETVTTAARAAAVQYLGATNVHDLPIRMGAEDFAFYSQYIPACFYRIGVGNITKGITSPIHSPTFDIDEQALLHSIGLMSWLVLHG